ncbi:AbrB family transcriptional regulator [Paenactinomyces guangxiensis]|uniref:AbrB family transcriptional regulator n=1 Tax=Paenactinomyces guangxiensis TaxID=1490290 RepID=A0A7W1WTZ6_9BACL|nr:AbrB family transcriptional regulator [Paenactinomyces guangxiensis]MBA4496015.1 AbrB family transcriptional regulator [Paenactinomyces guangxiensis]MBH8593109.1 AbrB family transcriptional regulator [Paenactinomyces guangxiensis]
MDLSKILLTLGCALAGGYLGYLLKIPAGAMIGSMCGVALANLSGLPLVRIPGWTLFILQVILGANIGLQINRGSVLELKAAWLPALLISIMTLLFGLGVGWIISKVTGWSAITSFFSSAPGGMTDLVLLANNTSADISKVTALHMVRLVTVIISVPIIIKLLFR